MAALPIAATISKPTAGAAPCQFHGWTGWVHGLAVRVDTAHRDGAIGEVAQENGQVAPDSTCTLYRFEPTRETALAFIARVEALPSATPYRLTDAYGREILIRITAAMAMPTRCKGPADDGTPTTYQVTTTLTCKRVPDAA